MHTRLLLLLLLAAGPIVVIAGGCDRAPLAGERLACKSDGDCPTEFVCSKEVSLCFSAHGLDRTPPSIVGALVSPPSATEGVTVVLTFGSSEALARNPVVVLDSGAPFSLAADGTSFVAKLVVVGGQAQSEGTHAILVTIVDEAGNVARKVNAGTITLDFTPPALSGDVTTSVVDGVDVLFALTEPLSADPTISLVPAGAGAPVPLAVAAGADDLHWHATLGRGAAADGAYTVTAEATDVAGNASLPLSLGNVVLDTVPASTRNGALVITPPAGSPLHAPTAAALGATIDVSFSTTEPVAALDMTPTACTNASTPFTVTATGGGPGSAFFAFSLAVTDAVDTSCPLLVHAVDEAGNAADVPIVDASGAPLTLVIDTTAPSITSIHVDKLELFRAPFGAKQTDGVPLLAIVPKDLDPAASLDTADLSSAFDDAVLVRAYTESGELVGEQPAGASLSRIDLDAGDARTILVSAVDEAGNESARAALVFGELIATLGGKIAGSAIENPTSLSLTTRMPIALFPDPAATHDAVQSEIDAAIAVDNDLVSAGAAGAFVDVSGDGSSPPPRDDMAFAFDAWRGELVIFGGSGPLDDTWTFSHLAWTQRHPPKRPPPREFAAMAFDPRRGVVVLFGGRPDTNAALGDTWEWDGTSWTERVTAHTPPARRNHAMAFDPTSLSVLVVGGFDPAGPTDFDDAWLFDGTDWVQTASGPAARFKTSALTLPGEGVLVVGGQADDSTGGSLVFDDTWRYANGEWSELDVAPAPARSEPRLFIEPTTGRPALFGGTSTDLSFATSDSGIFVLGVDGSWTRVGDGPGGRTGNAVAALPELGPVTFSGVDATGFPTKDTTWLFLAGARDVSPSPAVLTSGGTSGAPGILAASAYAPAIAHTVLGQHIAALPQNFIPSATPFDAQHVLFADSVPSMVVGFDEGRKQVVAVVTTSGQSAIFTLVNDQWLESTTMQQLAWSGLVFDEGRDALIGVAGTAGGRELGLTWNGFSFQTVTNFGGPAGAMVAYDRERQQIVAFGGGAESAVAATNETWVLPSGQQDWQQLSPTTSPSPRFGAAVTWDDDRRRVLLFGGDDIVANHFVRNAEAWEWDGANWTLVASGPMAGREYASLAPDAAYGAPVLRGGFTTFLSPHTDEVDTFAWRSSAIDRPAALWTVPVGRQLPPGAGGLSLRVDVVAGASGGAPGDVNASVDGVLVQRFTPRAGAWRSFAQASSPASAPAELVGVLDGSDLLKDGDVVVAVTSLAPGGASAASATVAVDAVELRVRYGVSAAPSPYAGTLDQPAPLAAFNPKAPPSCHGDIDCGAGFVCDEHLACDADCRTAGCTAGVCDQPSGLCRTPCTVDGDCQNGELCASGSCFADCRTGSRCGDCCDTSTGRCGASDFSSKETWSFDGTSFSLINVGGLPDDANIVAASPQAGNTIAFASRDFVRADVGALSGSSWQPVSFAPPTSAPTGETGFVMAALPTFDEVLVVTSNADETQTWIYDPHAEAFVEIGGPQPPTAKGAMIATGPDGKVLLYGGFVDQFQGPVDTMSLFNPTSRQWFTINSGDINQSVPGQLFDGAMTFDTTSGKFLMMGGSDGNQVFGFAWHLTIDESALTYFTDAFLALDPRREFSIANDKNGRIAIVGGIDDTGAFAPNLILDGFFTSPMPPGPSPRTHPAVAFDGTRTVVVGGDVDVARCVAP